MDAGEEAAFAELFFYSGPKLSAQDEAFIFEHEERLHGVFIRDAEAHRELIGLNRPG